ncbi:hypothetical protein Poli38472_010980 [Pythium oligandrum]|uniref:HSF-type DNA-binding domain-containing protein n=1 Tax=Pythium oligandrum TaxID=41045 RepID=A0A8K1CGW2_PYTOL|nr:hypothetical protein Poli38472_010980 [Pythium oligandrum]|eukprot:TMW61917.1 hypothetical protein Poli38472_010980 [Pythium oligandrum]
MVSVPDAAMTRTKEAAPFLKSLRRMLDTESEAVLRWTSDGRAFEIHDLEALTAHVLPKYFKHSKYTSFQRQLNYFNFRKWTKSRASVCTFSNTYFVRDDPELAWHISRKKSSPSSPNKPALSKTTARAKNIHIAISVPSRGSSGRSLFPFPSPTDVATTQGRDQESQFSESCWFSRNDMKLEPTVAPASLDWVDTLYPSLDIVSRYAEIPEFYSDYAAASRDGQASIMQF